MVSYYNSTNMYRHQQAVSTPNPPMHSWYTTGYHHQTPHHQMPPATYCMQDEQQMWHPAHHPGHAVFHNEFPEFAANIQHQAAMQHHHHQQMDPAVSAATLVAHNQLPSPTITVSGSEMSSPGAGSGNLSPSSNLPHNNNNNQSGGAASRPPPARSPYEWIKKTSYQTQPNPEAGGFHCITLVQEDAFLPDGKTRTRDKYRVVYTDMQRIELEKEFTFNNKYITIRRKAELAANLGLSERQIKIWFQNRRAKERKQNKKRIEEKNHNDMGNLFHGGQHQVVAAAVHHQQAMAAAVLHHTHHNLLQAASIQQQQPTHHNNLNHHQPPEPPQYKQEYKDEYKQEFKPE